MTTHETLVAAKAYLLTHGWHCGGWGDTKGNGPRCMVGALTAVASFDQSTTLAHQALMRVIGGPAMPWNDNPTRTLAEVIDVFDRCILATAPAETPEPVKEAVPA